MAMGERDFSHLDPHDSKTHADFDFSYPLSVPSQPPDIRNWFSSYEYESPDSPHLHQNDDSETQDPLVSLEIENQELSSSQAKDLILPDNCSGRRSQDESCLRDDCIQLEDSRNPLAEIERKSDIDGDKGNTECSYPIANGSPVRDQEELVKLPVAKLKRKLNAHQVFEDKCIAEPVEERYSADFAMNVNSSALKVHDDMLLNKQSVLKCNNEESDKNASTDGFISTKKRDNLRASMPIISMNHGNMAATAGVKGREPREHLMRGELKENYGILAGRKQPQAGRNSALTDRTNVQVEQGVVPGKWQCPRKSKPYVGPPMKQLRLEQWVRRVN